MATDPAKKRLGRGLAALIGDDTGEAEPAAAAAEQGPFRYLPVAFLQGNPRNPRKDFDEEEIEALAASIREKGVLQPIVVRPVADTPDAYEIVAGERRWRAAQRAKLHEVPTVVRPFTDGEALEIAIVENVQRSDLNPLEEAEGYSELIAHFDYTQDQLAKVIGKSRSHIANTLRLTNLPAEVREHLRSGALTAGHARALLGAGEAAARIAERIIAEGLSVRDAERLAKDDRPKAETTGGSGKARARGGKDADTLALERSLSDTLGLAVTVSHKGNEGGALTISYTTLEQLDEICRRLSQGS